MARMKKEGITNSANERMARIFSYSFDSPIRVIRDSLLYSFIRDFLLTRSEVI
jgi:hypothetical protein